jgi:hypothetical protein
MAHREGANRWSQFVQYEGGGAPSMGPNPSKDIPIPVRKMNSL